jgi:hypothetical protein
MDDSHTGIPQDQNYEELGRELALRVAGSALPRRLDSGAQPLLAECRTMVEFERRLDDLVDCLLERNPMIPEDGLMRGLFVTSEHDGDIQISALNDGEVGPEISPERLAKARAAYQWEQRADLRRALEKHVGPLLEVRKRWWLRRYAERPEQRGGDVEFAPVIVVAEFSAASLPAPPQLPLPVSLPKGKPGRPPISDDAKRRALAVWKGPGKNRNAAKVLYNSPHPSQSMCRSAWTIMDRFKRKAADRD